ncbi:hypothetical protein QCA50_011398 [Cerrena zonata]|uniref:Serine-threonine/tyrosine-protein kinase catalytic domain-containing protein n=1 Tax=Cerrena zonata TaxID=2478898 RepID=A0AAW0G7A4_9APHY
MDTNGKSRSFLSQVKSRFAASVVRSKAVLSAVSSASIFDSAVFIPSRISRARVLQLVNRLLDNDSEATNELESLQGKNARRALDIVQEFLDHNIDISATETDWGIPLSPGVRLVQSMVKLSELSGQYPSHFFVKINPPLSPKSNLTVMRGGSQTQVFTSEYQKKKVAVKRILIIGWELIGPSKRQIVQNVGGKLQIYWCILRNYQEFYLACLEWRQFRHPNILPIYGLLAEARQPTLILPWRERGNIRCYLQAT